ncbi:MAG: ATP-dependent DNA helicase RecG [Prevotellaceae bacterium]|jgi:ATP-dependent DNA helicase RecG|nr:ATP-dependent DNA helicase RecG [Prevotellaceae bacterium]
MLLSSDITYLPGVGPKKAATLAAELNVRTVEDLLCCYPYKYIDRSHFYTVREVDETMPYIQLKGQIVAFEKRGEGRQQRLIARFTDGTGFLELVWFQGIRFIEEKYTTGVEYVIFGKPTRFGAKLNIAHPDIEVASEAQQGVAAGLQAFYNTSEKMKRAYLHSAALRKIIMAALSDRSLVITETLPEATVREYALMERHRALVTIHMPTDSASLVQAQRRLKFEELFYVQLSILQQSKWREQKFKGYVFGTIGDYFNRFYRTCLPFELTGAQKRVIKEIRTDMATGRQMNRLLQGDVGSGKTIVALMTMLIALDNGFQACIMAPTEILATQHRQAIVSLVETLGITVRLLTGSTKKKERQEITQQLADGSLQIIIGTHALIEDSVVFKNLGVVIIDEQHRFGVAQRAKLWNKNIHPPHILVMTATPIPRTLAMTVYGDLDVSVIDELPAGRKPIATYHYFDNKRAALNRFIRQQVELGRQVYIVYPLIQESESLDLKNLEDGYQQMCETFPDLRIGMVHGKLKAADKEATMRCFVSGELQILMATTVIEVGVNVPNASVMVIESAERFGLSQLHQLRGRVGRGADQSYCVLMSSYKIGADTRRRLQIMVESTDGFVIAEADLNLRGPGDLDGTQQSGLPFDLKIANLVQDGAILSVARQVVQKLLDADPLLEAPAHRILTEQLTRLKRDAINWGVIS